MENIILNGLIPCRGLNSDEIKAIEDLERLCNDYEGISMRLGGALKNRPKNQITDFLYYEDHRLVGFLGMYSFNNHEAEVSSMVHPDYRNRGIFKELLSAAKEACKKRGFKRILVISETNSLSGKATMEAMGAKLSSTEHKMKLKGENLEKEKEGYLVLRKAKEEDAKERAKVFLEAFGMTIEDPEDLNKSLKDSNRFAYVGEIERKVIGNINASSNNGEIMIYGFGVLPEYRGLGYGRAMLTETVKVLKKEPHSSIALEVACDNDKALNLYKSCGFEVSTAYDYYEILLSEKIGGK